MGCSPWGRQESDMTERFHFHFSLSCIEEGNVLGASVRNPTRAKVIPEIRRKEKEKVKSLSRVCLCNLMHYSPPGSSVHGIFQVRVLEWGAIAFS